MKITDFGLWFSYYDGRERRKWLKTIPSQFAFQIYYDGAYLGWQSSNFRLEIYGHEPYIIVFKKEFPQDHAWFYFEIGRRLTIDDFDIIPNPKLKAAV